jgi:hypothetical protein
MNPQDETEIRAIIALHREIEDKKKEISKRLGVIRDRGTRSREPRCPDVRYRRRDLGDQTLG